MFVEQLLIERKPDGPPGSWKAPRAQTKPLDAAINDWVDETGNEIAAVSPPSMFMQWMDTERTMRLVVASVMVTYVPAVALPKPLITEPRNAPTDIPGWEPVV